MPTEQKSIKKTYLTIDDIAAMAGVSKSTVSRVLNNSGFVSEKTRTKVMDIVEANHYIPNSMARELGRTSTQSIGIFIGNISNSYYSEILSGAEAAINRSAFFPFICVVSNERREEFYVQEMLKRGRAASCSPARPSTTWMPSHNCCDRRTPSPSRRIFRMSRASTAKTAWGRSAS